MKCEPYSEAARQGEANSRGGDGRPRGLSPAAGAGPWGGESPGAGVAGGAGGWGFGDTPPSSFPAQKSPQSAPSLNHTH